MKSASNKGRASLFLFARTQGRLPACALLAWRRSNHLDLLFFGFLGFAIASLLTLGHVDLPGFVGDVGTGHPQSPMPWETRGCSILGLRSGDSECKNIPRHRDTTSQNRRKQYEPTDHLPKGSRRLSTAISSRSLIPPTLPKPPAES
jgi:hypothetical protein